MDSGQLLLLFFLTFTSGLLTLDLLCALYVPEIVNSIEMGGGWKQWQTTMRVALKAGNQEKHYL